MICFTILEKNVTLIEYFDNNKILLFLKKSLLKLSRIEKKLKKSN